MPRPYEPFSFLLTRRDVLFAAGAGAVSLVLPGCGGGGGHKGGSAVPAGSIAGTVEPGILASSSGLTVTNVYQANAPVGKMGAFSTVASPSGAMVHLVTDASGNVLGASLSIPGSAMTVNAESCLQALLFLTPGVLAIDPSEARQVIAKLQSQGSYATALAYLRTNLPTKSLQSLVQDATLPGLLIECVSDYNASRSRSRAITVDPPRNGLSLDLDTTTLSATRVTLINAGWRYVRVDRLEKDVEGNVLRQTTPTDVLGTHLVLGATPYSLPSLLAGTNGEPAQTQDANPLDLSTVATTEYWVQGPGWLVGEALPAQVPADADFAHTISLFYYVIWPVVQSVFGIPTDPLSALSKVEAAFFGIVLSIKRYLTQIESVNPAGKSTGQIAEEILESVKSILEAVLEKGVLVQAGLVSEVNNEAAIAFLKYLSVLFAAVNLVPLTVEWSGYEGVSHLSITSSATGGVTVQ